MNRTHFKTLTLALATAGALTLAGPALAKPKHDPVEHLTSKLELSEEQQHQLGALFEAHRDRMRAEGSRERSDRREARMALNAEIRELLDEAQSAKFNAMQRRAHAGRGSLRGPFQALDLSDEQRQQLGALMREHRAGEDSDRGELRERMQAAATSAVAITADAASAIDAIWPPDQGPASAGPFGSAGSGGPARTRLRPFCGRLNPSLHIY
jgi:Spy/CpxP family protein refolding chaperone